MKYYNQDLNAWRTIDIIFETDPSLNPVIALANQIITLKYFSKPDYR